MSNCYENFFALYHGLVRRNSSRTRARPIELDNIRARSGQIARLGVQQSCKPHRQRRLVVAVVLVQQRINGCSHDPGQPFHNSPDVVTAAWESCQ